MLLFLDPGSGMGKNQDPGSGIRDKHPGSATLVSIDEIANFQDVWNALVQIRQKTKQRKTLFYVEQLLLKYGATKVRCLFTYLLLDAMRDQSSR